MARQEPAPEAGNMALGFIMGAIIIGLAVVAYVVVARSDVQPDQVDMELTLPTVPAPELPPLPPVEPPTLPTPTPPVT